jgi:hypothetical protein
MLFDNTGKNVVNNLNENYIRKNLVPLKHHFNFSETKLLYDEKDLYFNMSLISFENELHYAVRGGHKHIGKMYLHPEFTSTVYVGVVDEAIKNKRQINVTFPKVKNGILGMEDPRIFEWKNKLFFSGDIPFNLRGRSQKNAFVNIETNECEVFVDPLNRKMSKNWMPYVSEDNLYFVIDVLPTRILDTKTRKAQAYNDKVVTNTPVYGGPRIINIDGIKTSIVHGRANNAYWHSIAQWDDNWNLKISDPFYFTKPGVEFCTGYEVHNGKLYFTYSEYDDGVVLCSIDLDSFLDSAIWSRNV